MKYFYLCMVICIFVFSGCKNKTQTGQPGEDKKKGYFPVADFLQSEIHYVDSLPLGITVYHTQNNKTDTSYIKAAVFDPMAKEFIPGVLTSSAFETDYTETSFMDQTLQAVTFTYSTQNSSQELKRIDVIAKPDMGPNQVQSIYMEKAFVKNNAHIIKKMYWKARKSFLVVTNTQYTDKPPVIDQLKVVWDKRD